MEFSHEIYHNIHSLLYHKVGRQQSLGSPEPQLSWTWVSVWTFSQQVCCLRHHHFVTKGLFSQGFHISSSHES